MATIKALASRTLLAATGIGLLPAGGLGQSAQLQRHTVESDGHPIAVWEKSPEVPRGTIVLVHGRTWSSLPDFDLQVPGEDLSLMDGLVAEGFATYAVDLRGYGATPRDSTGWITPNRAYRDVVEVLGWVGDRTGTTPALFGWSNGSMVAQLTAQRSAHLISALILFGYPVRPEVDWSQIEPEAETPPRLPTTAEAAASDFIVPGSISEAAVREYVRHSLEADPVRADWRELSTWAELDAASVLVPTLLLQGERDPLALPENQAALFWKLGTADRMWVTLPGGDHAAHLETPRPRFIHAITTFLTRPR
jgi:pimeloyl-ACP methyl ester carboxylesterase